MVKKKNSGARRKPTPKPKSHLNRLDQIRLETNQPEPVQNNPFSQNSQAPAQKESPFKDIFAKVGKTIQEDEKKLSLFEEKGKNQLINFPILYTKRELY